MATQTGSIDMGAMAEAAKTANDYITDVTSAGIQVHPKGDATSYAAIDANGMSVVKESESVAHFGEETRIGKADESHMELDYHSMRMIDSGRFTYFEVQDMRDEHGLATIVDTFIGDGHTTGFNLSLSAYNTGYDVEVSDSSGGTPVKGTSRFDFSTAPTDGATITATYKTTSQLAKAYTIGHRVGRAGYMSVVAGHGCTASGSISHAEGSSTASGLCSHAEGTGTASGDFSHASGYRTVAASNNQTAIGKYNDNDPTNAFEIGNGTSDSTRSNALTVAWDGTVTAAGEVKGASVEASVTLASGVAADTHAVRRSGKMVTVYVVGLNLAAELANHGTAVVATVPSGYRPAYAAYAQLPGWNNGGSYVTVGTNGSVTVNNQSGAAIPTARELGFTVSYVM